MNSNREVAQRANRAADAIGDSILGMLEGMRSAIADRFELDERLVSLAIAKAAMGITADAASQATGMVADECDELEDRLHAVVTDAIDEFAR
jgi:hypothetical protein